jgi:hypothetical protein
MALLLPLAVSAQAPRSPREFPEFRGMWAIDAAVSKGNLAGVARHLTIQTTPTTIAVSKDANLPYSYPIDGSELRVRHAQSGVPLDVWLRLTLVAENLALTTKLGSGDVATIITELYHADGDVLMVEREVSALTQSSGTLITPGDIRNVRQTLVYRRDGAQPPQAN